MAQGFHRIHGVEIVRSPVAALGNEVFKVGTPVWLDAAGFVATIVTNERPYGYCTEDYTAISTNSSSSTLGITQTNNPAGVGYAPRIIAPDNVDFWMDCDQALAQTDIGQYMDVTISSGVVTGNLSSGSTGLFLVKGLRANEDPSSEGDTDRVICTVAERQEILGA